MPLSIHAKTRVEEKLRGGSTLNQRWQPAAAEVEVIAEFPLIKNQIRLQLPHSNTYSAAQIQGLGYDIMMSRVSR